MSMYEIFSNGFALAMETTAINPLYSMDDTLEWTYAMRRSMQEIVCGLFLGPYSAAMKSKVDYLLESGITHIICVRQEMEAHFIRPNFPEKFKYIVLDIADSPTTNIIQFLSRCLDDTFKKTLFWSPYLTALQNKLCSRQEIIIKNIYVKQVKVFIDECLANGGKALVHGNAGISRSAALVIGYIMETFNLTYREAYLLVQQKRFCINPNDGFAHQLQEFEPIYKAKHTFFKGESSKTTGHLKRRIEEVEDLKRNNDMEVCEQHKSNS